MISYDFGKESARGRSDIYDLLSPLGKAHIAQLLREEKKIFSNFVESYESPQLRRLAAKKTGLTEEEQELLNSSPKVFKGVLKNGDMIEDKKAVEVIADYLKYTKIIDVDLKQLSGFEDDKYTANAEIILGKPLTYWNLHPNKLDTTIYETIFDSPQYIKNEINKLVQLKIESMVDLKPQRLFPSEDSTKELLLNYRGTAGEKKLLSEKLYSLRVMGEASPIKFRENLKKVVSILIDKDNEFDKSIYLSLKNVLPQYHNQKLKYFIYLLAQYNSVSVVPINPRIDLTELHAFYRKADELCS